MYHQSRFSTWEPCPKAEKSISNYFQQLLDLLTMVFFSYIVSVYISNWFNSLLLSFSLSLPSLCFLTIPPFSLSLLALFDSLCLSAPFFQPNFVSSLYCHNAFPLCVCVTCQQHVFVPAVHIAYSSIRWQFCAKNSCKTEMWKDEFDKQHK